MRTTKTDQTAVNRSEGRFNHVSAHILWRCGVPYLPDCPFGAWRFILNENIQFDHNPSIRSPDIKQNLNSDSKQES